MICLLQRIHILCNRQVIQYKEIVLNCLNEN